MNCGEGEERIAVKTTQVGSWEDNEWVVTK